MHVPGVKQEQPDRRDPVTAPIFIDFTVRDGNNTRLVKAAGKSPEDAIRILNSILRKMNNKDNALKLHKYPQQQEEETQFPTVV